MGGGRRQLTGPRANLGTALHRFLEIALSGHWVDVGLNGPQIIANSPAAWTMLSYQRSRSVRANACKDRERFKQTSSHRNIQEQFWKEIEDVEKELDCSKAGDQTLHPAAYQVSRPDRCHNHTAHRLSTNDNE
jgi:hypothetical protein